MKSSRIKSLVLLLVWLLCAAAPCLAQGADIVLHAENYPIAEGGFYESPEEVSVYLDTYGALPKNYLTKDEARSLGWDVRAGNLWHVAPGCSIGGDRFGNYENSVPAAKGRTWKECDLNYAGGYRGGERLVFSSDGLIYYSDDHYETFRRVRVVRAKAAATPEPAEVVYGECYTANAQVAAYLHAFGELPINYITKAEAREIGFDAKKDNLGEVAPGFAVGGDIFQNRERLLPEASGRVWRECDVDMVDGKRGAFRIVYSSDGLIYETRDGYKSFTRLY